MCDLCWRLSEPIHTPSSKVRANLARLPGHPRQRNLHVINFGNNLLGLDDVRRCPSGHVPFLNHRMKHCLSRTTVSPGSPQHGSHRGQFLLELLASFVIRKEALHFLSQTFRVQIPCTSSFTTSRFAKILTMPMRSIRTTILAAR